MGVSRIEQLIEDIYEFIESCRMQPLSTTKVIVPKDELYDLLDELRLRTPDEIKRYQKIIANRDAIIADAEEKAAAILAQAEEKAHSLVNEHEIMQQAYYEANEMVSKASVDANKNANQIRSSALAYTEDMLSDVETILTHTYDSTKSKYEDLINSIQGNLEIVINNKKELRGQEYEAPQEVNQPSEPEKEAPAGEDFEFDENTFLQDL